MKNILLNKYKIRSNQTKHTNYAHNLSKLFLLFISI